jgi:hypothetical protein
VAESLHMRDYYKHATITISADSAPGGPIGFLKRERPATESFRVKLTFGEDICIRRRTECPYFPYIAAHVAARAWNLQEFVLVPRSLLYSSG